MNVRDSEFDRMLAEWLEDDTFVAPAAPVEAAVDFARIHPRRRDWLAFLRRDAMTTRATTGLRPVAILLTVAALLALGVGAVYVASRPGPTPTPTVNPSPSATPLGVLPMPPSGALVAGRYRLDVPDSPVTVDLTIGEGWTSGDWYIMNPPDFTHHISFWTAGNVPTDACDWNGTQPNPPIGPTVDDLISALDAQMNTDMSAPIEAEVGGHAGKQVTMQIAADFAPPGGICDPDLTMWVGPDGEQGRSVAANLDNPPDTVWILDVDGQRVVIVTTYDPSDAEAQAVMDSLEFAVN